jgi:spore photoproduct lyase family protein
MLPYQPSTILYTPDALNDRGRAICDRFPEADVLEIRQHNRLPDLGLSHFKAKSELLVLGRLKTLESRYSGRSSDFVAPSLSSGCLAGCTYCYVDRHKAVNPITIFTNVDEILDSIDRHAFAQPWPRKPDQTDPVYWVYDIGCNADLSVDATIADSVADAVDFFREHPRAKGTFATKFVNRDLLHLNPDRKTRIRFSLMPAAVSQLVDVRTDSIAERLAALNDFYDAGYELHLNFSPVIVYGTPDNPRQWRDDYAELFRQVDATLRPDVKPHVQCEVIFLTHNAAQHRANQHIHPKGEAMLWKPEWQETKISQFGGENMRYRHDLKAEMARIFRGMLAEYLPWCTVRYLF